MRFYTWVLAAGLALTGCSTMTNGTGQYIAFNTAEGISDVSCHAKNGDHFYDIIAPTTHLIERQKKIIKITCKKAGYEDFVTELKPRVARHAYAKNIWNGIAPGAALDAMSGAHYAYPEQVNIDLIPLKQEEERYITLYEDTSDASAVTMPSDDMYDLLKSQNTAQETINTEDPIDNGGILDQGMNDHTLHALDDAHLQNMEALSEETQTDDMDLLPK